MPRVIVLTSGDGATTMAAAQATASGAESVRFTEVDVRTTSSGLTLHALREYDAIIVVTSGGTESDTRAHDLLRSAQCELPADAFLDTVFAAAAPSDMALLTLLASLGGIIVTVPRGAADAAAQSRALGARVATVVEWVRHARSHEHGHAQVHSHHHH